MISQIRQQFYTGPIRGLLRPLIEVARTTSFLANTTAAKSGPVPHQIKVKLIKSRLANLSSPVFVETGTYLGDTVAAVQGMCAQIISIEVDPKLCASARRRFVDKEHISILEGDCLEVFPQILHMLKRPAVFWLDAHYSGGITGRGKVDDPILISLAHLKTHPITHAVLVDDARTFDGRDSRPALIDVFEALRDIDPDYRLSVFHDVIIAER
jgi:hypothetical protein